MNDYATPMWQKKKARCLERAGYKCEACCAEDVLLHAHHTIYPKGKKVYDVSDASLVCLCENCHAKMTKAIDLLRLNTLNYLRFTDWAGDGAMAAISYAMDSFYKGSTGAALSCIEATALNAASSILKLASELDEGE